MIRTFAFSFSAATVAACTLLAVPQASARALGTVSINTTGPITRTPSDPWGGVMLCTAHLRKYNPSTPGGWDYHMSSGYDYGTCLADANPYLSSGWGLNPNPGFGLCQCFPGFNGFLVVGPSGNGPLGEQNLSSEQIQKFDQGMTDLRKKYQFDKFLEESQQLLDSIEATSTTPDGN
jgi:hypothetical protein